MSAAAEALYTPAAHQALAAFGIIPTALRFVKISENVTFRVIDAADGAVLVLRLHRPGYHDIDKLRSEHAWTRALVTAGVAAPAALLTPSGEGFAEVEVAATGERRWAGLARWVEGELLDEVVAREADPEANARHFARLGGLMAAMHDQAVGWVPPPGFTRHALDADGLMGAAPFWGPFWDHPIFPAAERRTLLATRDMLHAALTRLRATAAGYSLIHADLHPRNLVVHGSEPARDRPEGKPSGRESPARLAVIDFDDCGFGWHLYDLAVALVNYQDHPGFPGFRAACVAGYRAVRPLAEAELALLPMFLLCRDLAQIGWYHQRPELLPAAGLPELKARALRAAAGFAPPC